MLLKEVGLFVKPSASLGQKPRFLREDRAMYAELFKLAFGVIVGDTSVSVAY